MKNPLALIPGTKAHVDKTVERLFGEEMFDRTTLSESESRVLEASKKDKYGPAILESARARYLGAVVGAIAPYDFLLIGSVILASSAASTTGAWYNITLKEMKAQFEKMGLNLTSKLLKSDMLANAFAMYTGIGFGYKAIALPAIQDMVQEPNAINGIRATVALLISGTIHKVLESILSNKEEASIQFDYNDATLAGMTEEQQRFFAKAVSEVGGALDNLKTITNPIQTNRAAHKCIRSLTDLVRKFDVQGTHSETFQKIDSLMDGQEKNYDTGLKPFMHMFSDIITKLSSIVNLTPAMIAKLEEKARIISLWANEENEHTQAQFVAVVTETVPIIFDLFERNGERALKS